MRNSEIPSRPSSYIGRVKNGVVVFETPVALPDGQAVRVEPVGDPSGAPLTAEQANQLHRLQDLFAEWTEEDGKLTEEEADCLHKALEQSPRARFRSPDLA